VRQAIGPGYIAIIIKNSIIYMNMKKVRSLFFLIGNLEDRCASLRKLTADILRAQRLQLLDQPFEAQVKGSEVVRLHTALLGQRVGDASHPLDELDFGHLDEAFGLQLVDLSHHRAVESDEAVPFWEIGI
jgi:hypothetical protein